MAEDCWNKTDEDTDASLMRRGYASIVPIRYDMTADKLKTLR